MASHHAFMGRSVQFAVNDSGAFEGMSSGGGEANAPGSLIWFEPGALFVYSVGFKLLARQTALRTAPGKPPAESRYLRRKRERPSAQGRRGSASAAPFSCRT